MINIEYKKGWNLIGFTKNKTLDEVKEYFEGNYIENTLYRYEVGSGYKVITDNVEPYRGYWIRLSNNITIQIPEPEPEPIKIQCLLQDQNNNVQMINPYTFNNISYNDFDRIGLNRGTYTFTGITNSHPIGFVIEGTDKIEVISGTVVGTKNIEGIDVTHYKDTVKIIVKDNFDIISYNCFNHGYMGGEKRLIFSESCPIDTSEPEP